MRFFTSHFVLLALFAWHHHEAPAQIRIEVSGITEIRSENPDLAECQITLTLRGQELTDALDVSHWTLENAHDDSGNPLLPMDHDQPLRLTSIEGASPPAATLILTVSPPTRQASRISQFSGTLVLNRYRQQIAVIENILQKPDGLIENPLFITHEFLVYLTDPGQALPGGETGAGSSLRDRAVALNIEGDVNRVHLFDLTTADGTLIPTRPAGYMAGRTRLMACISSQPLPQDTQARLHIPIDPEPFEVPFALKEIPLP